MKGIFAGRDLGSAQGGDCPAPCLGYSYVNGEPVTDTFARVLPVTISIVLPAAVLWLGLGVGLGLLSALRRGTIFDRLAIGVSLTGASMQLYFVGGVLLLVFVYTLKILPYPRYTPITDNPLQWAEALVLPWCALAFLFSAIYARLSRAQMLETLSEDFVRTAEAKGLRRRTVVGKHALRAALTPVADHRRAGHRRGAGRHGHHRDHVRAARPRPHRGRRGPRERPADHHGHRPAGRRRSSSRPTSSSTCSTRASIPGYD